MMDVNTTFSEYSRRSTHQSGAVNRQTDYNLVRRMKQYITEIIGEGVMTLNRAK